MQSQYKKQVELLLRALPEVGKESCFAMHGGTTINLFLCDMPRLSVDIDLTYIPIENREETISNINDALDRIKNNLVLAIPNLQVKHQNKICKLLVSLPNAQIKIEVNTVGRGLLKPFISKPLCQKAQEKFDVFCVQPVVDKGQVYGGKICAGLDRQHPRDLFDIKILFENGGITEDIKHGFLLGLLSSDRPIHELLDPNRQDQRAAFSNQFEGMASIPFSYEEYETIREKLIKEVNLCLTKQDKKFLLSVKNLTPDWTVYDFEKFPSVRWKLQNIQKLKELNPEKYKQQLNKLKKTLYEKY